MKSLSKFILIPLILFNTIDLEAQHRLSGDRLEIVQNLSNQGDKKAQLLLGMHFLSFSNKGRFQEDARKWLKRSADQGLAEAQFQYAKEIYRDKTPEIDKIALFYFEKSARQGHYKAALQTAEMYYFGFGTLRFPNRAFNLFKICADSGDAKAQFYAAKMYYTGEGVNQNKFKAFDWCVKSSNQKYPPAYLLLAQMYISGHGTSLSMARAAKFTKLAFDNGEVEAQELWDNKQLWKYME